MQNRIKEIRIKKGYSLDYVSKATKIPKSSLSEYEKGPRQPRKKEIWEELARIFEVSVPYLMGLSDASNEIDKEEIINFLEQASIKKENEILAADFNFPKTTDLAGNEIQAYNKEKFNLVVAKIDFIGCRIKSIKNSNNLNIRYILKFTDPTNDKIKFTSIRALLLTEYIDFNLSTTKGDITFPLYLYTSDEQDTFNDIIDFDSLVNKIEGLESEHVTHNLTKSYLRFQKMIDDDELGSERKKGFLHSFCDYNTKILSDRFKSIDLDNSTLFLKYKINLFNEEYIHISL